MAEIQILDDLIVNQIAAGEVVERPASVVKELVENSIDAGSTEVSVSLINGGKSGIEVRDNGSGMDSANAKLALERFGTSKIRNVSDLESISTHGFRGEALPSIASVSQFRLSTQLRELEAGTVIDVHGGIVKGEHSVALLPGTKIEVANLFYNVPARRKFLKSDTTEVGQVKSLLLDFALAYPELRLRLVSDGKELASFAPGGDFFTRAKKLAVAGEKPLECRAETDTAQGAVIAEALLSQPIECVPTSGRLRLLVNKRSVRDKLLLRAVRDGYGNFLRPGRYPQGVLHLTLPPSEVDVNVHPQKAEVRFRRSEIVFATVRRAVEQALRNISAANLLDEDSSPLHSSAGGAYSSGREFPGNWQMAANSASYQRADYPQAVQENFLLADNLSGVAGSSLFLARETVPRPELNQMKFVGQVLSCYLILEAQAHVAILDMHAAHERVMFFKIKSQLNSGPLNSQLLLIPEKITLPEDKREAYEQGRELLNELGFETDLLSAGAIVVRSVPALLSDISVSEFFQDLFAVSEWSDWTRFVSDARDRVIARLACHRSIRKGRKMDAVEVYALLDLLKQAEASGLCPHGRPIVKWFRESEFESLFGRDV